MWNRGEQVTRWDDIDPIRESTVMAKPPIPSSWKRILILLIMMCLVVARTQAVVVICGPASERRRAFSLDTPYRTSGTDEGPGT